MFNFSALSSMRGKKHADFIEEWRKAMANGTFNGRPFSPQTQNSYVSYMTKFLSAYEKLSYSNLITCLGNIPTHQYCKKNQIHQAAVSFGKYLIEQKALNPVFLTEVKKLKPKRHLPAKQLTVRQEGLTDLIKCCKNPLDILIIILLASTGLRASEACSLTLNDIRFDERKIYVRKGKWGKARRVGITDGLLVALQQYLVWKGELMPKDSLLTNGSKRPLNRNGLYQRLKKLERRVGVEVTPHALRRAFVTINVANGIPLVYLQVACVHSDITTTRSYCQTTEEEVIEAMNTRFTNFSSC